MKKAPEPARFRGFLPLLGRAYFMGFRRTAVP